MKLTIIIPVYNEDKTVLKVIEKVRRYWKNRQIIVVDDGSTDRTGLLLDSLKAEDLVVLHHKKNQGKGAAIRTAVPHAIGECTLIQDADLEYDPEDYKRLIKPIRKGKAEVVYGSRFLGEHRNLLFWNWVANHLLNLCTNILFNTTLSDLETGYKVFRTTLLKDLIWHANGFDFEPEITARILRRHIYIYDVPIGYTGRNYAQGKKIRAKDGLIAFWTILKYRFWPI